MDPYLEHPDRWPGMHQSLIYVARSALNEVLPSEYVADIGERVYVVQPKRGTYPDLVVLESPPAQGPAPRSTRGATVAGPSDPPWVLTVHPVELREVFIQILPVSDQDRVVAVIEFLSPSNKAPSSEGRQLYLTKQQELLKSQTHLIEIDLLHQGEHTVAAPRDRLLEMGTWDYLACLHRAGQSERYEVWPVSLRKRLPRILVPLAEGDPDVVLDLQAIFDRAYDDGPYARRIDYRRDLPAGLSAEDAEWARALLRERGLT
jgi:hypothetical protein